jgi:hypothetical protein
VTDERTNDCLHRALAYALAVDYVTVPYVPVDEDWDRSWKTLCRWGRKLGWYLTFSELRKGTMFTEYVREWGPVLYVWIASVTHPSWPDEYSHAIVMRGPSIEYDPFGDLDQRPPLEEFGLEGGIYFTALDPAKFDLRAEPRSRVLP